MSLLSYIAPIVKPVIRITALIITLLFLNILAEPFHTPQIEVNEVKTSTNGRLFIEGKEGLRLTAYADSGGVLTIGYGHTGSDVTHGLTITKDQADALLAQDLKWAENKVMQFVKVPLSQSQFDALVSFTYNTGVRFSLINLVNTQNTQAVSKQMLSFVHDSKGNLLKGLVVRRTQEAAMFCTAPCWVAPVDNAA